MPSTRRARPTDANDAPVDAPRAADAAAAPADAAAAAGGARGERVLKKYPNRRLYDTRASTYITLADVKQMVLGGEAFEVRDAKSGEDLTRSILLQIILEEEAGGKPLFTTAMLTQMIRFYGHAMQGLMGQYLEQNLQAMAEFQARLASQALIDPTRLTSEAWAQMLRGQGPLAQGLMGNVLDQSRQWFSQWQEQMQSGTFFPGLRPTKGSRPE